MRASDLLPEMGYVPAAAKTNRSVVDAHRSVDPPLNAADEAGDMNETSIAARPAASKSRHAALLPVIVLFSCFAAVSALMLAALIVLAATGYHVDTAMWVRCSIVLASAVLLLVFADRAAHGTRSAVVRLRIITPIVFAALVVIALIPGFLPDWARAEQALCALLLIPAVILLWMPRTMALFGPKVES